MPKHNILTQEQFIADCNEKHGLDTYDYSEVIYVRGRDRIKVICPKEGHGPWHPEARKHRAGTGCRKCYIEGKRITKAEMLKRFIDAHGDTYSYDFSNYNGAASSIQIKCPLHDWFPQICEVHSTGVGCPDCGSIKTAESRRMSFAEFLTRSIERFGEKYHFIENSWSGINQRIGYICVKHGMKTMLASAHLKSPTGCKECSTEQRGLSTRLTQHQFIQRSKLVHKDKYDYTLTKYQGSDVKVDIICPEHRVFRQNPSTHLSGAGCKRCADIEIGKKRKEQSEEGFWSQVEAVHGNTYDLSKVVYNGVTEDIIVGCSVHKNFTIQAGSFKNGRGCKECGRERTRQARNSTLSEFITKAKAIHGDTYIYDNVNYINAKTNVMITCRIHDGFPQQPTNHLAGNGCPACGNYGFDPSLPATLYYVKIVNGNMTAYKIGITNRTIGERFYSEMDMITVLHTESHQLGLDAYNKEQNILNMYPEHKYLGPPLISSGNTELFSKDILGLDVP